MKKFALLILILMSATTFSQENNDLFEKKATSFTYNKNGLSPSKLTVKVNKFDKKELYEKVLEWVGEKYKDPNKVIKKKEKNDKIKIEGFTDNALCFGVKSEYSCEGLTYTIEFTFEDEEYKIKPSELYYTSKNDKKVKLDLKKSDFYTNSGDPLEGYEKISSQIETLFNSLNKSVLNYITNKDQEDEW
ncbi:MAG: DUF4468 domain-containing protein [Flavobacteriales bacterium]|nr:DUF4468 domain-containing protein [Flavobacteriia bacterium]NCP06625.1 DUF4468 domain-containing protein [Flavobacteriales bacterium]PIV93040.1 MAG: hypothetical protein COW44_11760 [Flavobacteriaceae bacterium CG17_big_fil_post_rev_8_21_14_2_50_33_15]PIY10091.1 MAG: hypothetical protein COZ17_10965 [Flavobacteriaceae bacterium CG_4_10_14_3_um_filter_33_47]PJB19933.1 MAG: hypothetical protein CO117_02830 [Flavobacteriaceae bacterium CG_4_9_14_3_um_filter_33_16]